MMQERWPSVSAGAVDAVLWGHGAIERRDAVAVRVAGGVTELGGDAGLKFFRDEVLEAFGFVVQLVECVAEDFEEEGFDEAVVAHDLQRAAAAGGREPDAVATLVLDERTVLGSKLLQHVGDGGRSDTEALGKLGAADTALLAATERVDGFQVVVDGLAGAALGAGLHDASLVHLAAGRFCGEGDLLMADEAGDRGETSDQGSGQVCGDGGGMMQSWSIANEQHQQEAGEA
jgi:hypothetical protein